MHLQANPKLTPSDSEVVYNGISKPNKKFEESFKKNGIDTMEKVFVNAAQEHGKRKALGTRKVLGEEDEVQENGRVFKKVNL